MKVTENLIFPFVHFSSLLPRGKKRSSCLGTAKKKGSVIVKAFPLSEQTLNKAKQNKHFSVIGTRVEEEMCSSVICLLMYHVLNEYLLVSGTEQGSLQCS